MPGGNAGNPVFPRARAVFDGLCLECFLMDLLAYADCTWSLVVIVIFSILALAAMYIEDCNE